MMAVSTCMSAVLLLLFLPQSSLVVSASQMDQLSWVSTSRCRVACVEEYLTWGREESHSLVEEDCIDDYGGCFTCWRMCELLVADAPRWSYWCQDNIPDSQCSSGCRTACDFINNMETVYYAEEMMEAKKTQVSFHNDSALVLSVQNPLPTGHLNWAVVFLVYYKHDSRSHWNFFLSTFQLQFPIYGQYKRYNKLVFQIKAVSTEGVVSIEELDVEQLMSLTTTAAETSETETSDGSSITSPVLAEASSTPREGTSTTESPAAEYHSTILSTLFSLDDGTSSTPDVETTSEEATSQMTNTIDLQQQDSLSTIDIVAIVVICSNLAILAVAFLVFYSYMRKRSVSAGSLSSSLSSLPRLDLTDLEKSCHSLQEPRLKPLATSSTVTSLTDLDKCEVAGSTLDLTALASGFLVSGGTVSPYQFCFIERQDEVCSLSEEAES